MALVYFDSSALVSLCVQSARSPLARRLWLGADLVVTSHVARVQVPAALAQAHRREILPAQQLEEALDLWQDVLAGVYVVEAGPSQSEAAARFAVTHDLRADDAWHLAAASVFAGRTMVAAVWDERLRVAASEVGLRVCG